MRSARLLALLILASGLVSAPACAPAQADVPVYTAKIVKTYPHDPAAFTEGLYYRDGYLYESTGRNGTSFIRQVRLDTGAVVKQAVVDSRYFGEGIAPWGDQIVSLTWTGGAGFVWSDSDFRLKRDFSYSGEGWGLTADATHLIMSDGTSDIRFLDPATFETVRTIGVTLNGRPIDQINELEWVDGELYANIWRTRQILCIDPATGKATGIIDLRALPETQARDMDVDAVANGIAWDAAGKRLFVTGKLWPNLYEIQLVRR